MRFNLKSGFAKLSGQLHDELPTLGSNEEALEVRFKRLLFLGLAIIIFPLIIGFGSQDLIGGRILEGGLQVLLGSVLVFSLYFMHKQTGEVHLFRLLVALIGLIFSYLVVDGGDSGSKLLWLYGFPLVCLFLLGKKEGLLWSSAMLIIIVTIFGIGGNVSIGPIDVFQYPQEMKIRFISSFLAVLVLTGFYEIARQRLQQGMRNKQLQLEKEVQQHKNTAVLLQRLATAVTQSAEAILITNKQGQIEFINPAVEKISGYTKHELLGAKPSIFQSGQHDKAFYKKMWNIIENGCVWNGNLINRRKDGTLYEEHGSISPVFNDEGQIINYVAVKRDISEERLLEKQLDQARRLEALGTLAGGVAHEINTPTQYVADNLRFLNRAFGDLGAFLNICRQLVDGAQNNRLDPQFLAQVRDKASVIDLDFLQEEIPPALTQSLEGLESIRRIVLSMKEFSHPGTKEKVPVDINKAIETTLTISRNEWKYVADVDLELDPDLPVVVCLPGELNQALLNMVVNAAHAIENVVGCDSGLKGRIGISTCHTGSWVEIRIDDDGSGIPESIREQIFNPFFTTKEAGKGTGQGLAITHTVIVEKHGGQISFHSLPGKGTCFIVKLPINVRSEND